MSGIKKTIVSSLTIWEFSCPLFYFHECAPLDNILIYHIILYLFRLSFLGESISNQYVCIFTIPRCKNSEKRRVKTTGNPTLTNTGRFSGRGGHGEAPGKCITQTRTEDLQKKPNFRD